MATRIGINGFGRIGRQVFKAIKERHGSELEVVAINDLVDNKTNAHLLKYDSNYGRYPGTVEAGESGLIVDGKAVSVFAEKEPGDDPVGQGRRQTRHRVHRLLHRCEPGARAHPRRREESDHLRAGEERRCHGGARRQRRQVRPGEAQRRLERLVHDERPRADGEGAARQLRHHQGPDDDDTRLHELAAPARHAVEGPARGPRRRAQHRSDFDGRRARSQARDPGDRRQARRRGVPRTDADGIDRRIGMPGREGDDRPRP